MRPVVPNELCGELPVPGSRPLTLSFSRMGAETLLRDLEDMPYRTLTGSSHLMELRHRIKKMLEDSAWK